MSNSHNHEHGACHHHHGAHVHAHGVSDRLWLAFILNLSFAVIELIGGYLTNSVAVSSDAVHDFGDAFAIGLALGLEYISNKKSDANYSYGYRRFSTMAAVITGMVLVAGSVFILVESIPRLLNPVLPHTDGMIGLAFLGLAVNGYAAFRVSKGTSLSEKMILWHLLEDVLGWVLVLVGALVMKFIGYPQIDAIMGALLALWVLYNVFRNLRSAFSVFLQGVPKQIDVPHLLKHLRQIADVRDIHHVHVWSLDGDKHIFTGHVIVDRQLSMDRVEILKREMKSRLASHQITEATLEIEAEGAECFDPQHS